MAQGGGGERGEGDRDEGDDVGGDGDVWGGREEGLVEGGLSCFRMGQEGRGGTGRGQLRSSGSHSPSYQALI